MLLAHNISTEIERINHSFNHHHKSTGSQFLRVVFTFSLTTFYVRWHVGTLAQDTMVLLEATSFGSIPIAVPVLILALLACTADGFVVRPVPPPSSRRAHHHVPFMSLTSDEKDRTTTLPGNTIDEKGGRVSVQIVTELPHVSTACEARDAWIEHHWIKGGGLPILSLQRDATDEAAENEKKMRRVIAPIMMEEVLDLSGGDEPDEHSLTLQYRVTKPGPAFAPDLVAGSHLGNVSFEPNDNKKGYKMIWSVQFDTKRLVNLYQRVTEFTIGTAARTVAEATSVPRFLTLDATLKGVDDPIEARRQWLEFIWAKGGGLPLLPPIMKGQVLNAGGGKARRELLRIPPAIIEKIVTISETDDGSSSFLEYKLYRPGLTTFPFLMHSHHARVSFAKDTSAGGENTIVLHWEVEIRPFPIPIIRTLVEKLTEMTVATLVRNFVVYLAEPGAQVEIRPPRGNSDLAGGVKSFGSVPKDWWVGGVLYAHLSDTRSTVEQTLSLLQPWTWGRSGHGDETDAYVRYQWTDKTSITKPAKKSCTVAKSN